MISNRKSFLTVRNRFRLENSVICKFDDAQINGNWVLKGGGKSVPKITVPNR